MVYLYTYICVIAVNALCLLTKKELTLNPSDSVVQEIQLWYTNKHFELKHCPHIRMMFLPYC